MGIRMVTSTTPLMSLVMGDGWHKFLKSTALFILKQMSMKLHSKLGSFLRIKTKVLKRLQLGQVRLGHVAVSAERGQLS